MAAPDDRQDTAAEKQGRTASALRKAYPVNGTPAEWDDVLRRVDKAEAKMKRRRGGGGK